MSATHVFEPQPPQSPTTTTPPRDGRPSCRGRGGSVASHVLVLILLDMDGEAGRQPGGLPGQRAGSDDG